MKIRYAIAGFSIFGFMEANLYGLVGKNIGYSFSREYFTEKFRKLRIDADYKNFDIAEIGEFPALIAQNPSLKGLNVTIPYKESVIEFLDALSETAKEIGAANTIEFASGKLIGHNTDHYGFQKSIEKMLQPHHRKALILGTGGASKAVAFALEKLGIPYRFVSREPENNILGYKDLDKTVFEEYQIVINTTPLGTFPDTENCPDLPYENFTSQHLTFDLIYNPVQTEFLRQAKKHGAQTQNGLEMLQLQAEKAWEIWNK